MQMPSRAGGSCRAPAPTPGNAVTRRDFARTIALTGAAGASLLLGGCSASPEGPLRVGAVLWPGYEPLFLARKLGLLEGEPIKLVEYPSTPEALRAFLNGALEVVAITTDEFLRLARTEPSVRAFLVTDISNGADALVSQPQFETLESLKGRRIGVEVNAMAVYMLTRALASAGMSASDIQVLPMGVEDHLASYQRGELDAVVCYEPNRTRLLAAGARVLFDSSRIPGEVVDLLAVREKTMRERKARLRTLAQAWFGARQFFVDNPEKAAELMAPRLGVTAGEMLASLQLLKLPCQAENQEMLRPSGTLLASFERVHQFMSAAGHFAAAAPSAALITDEVLP